METRAPADHAARLPPGSIRSCRTRRDHSRTPPADAGVVGQRLQSRCKARCHARGSPGSCPSCGRRNGSCASFARRLQGHPNSSSASPEPTPCRWRPEPGRQLAHRPTGIESPRSASPQPVPSRPAGGPCPSGPAHGAVAAPAAEEKSSEQRCVCRRASGEPALLTVVIGRRPHDAMRRTGDARTGRGWHAPHRDSPGAGGLRRPGGAGGGA